MKRHRTSKVETVQVKMTVKAPPEIIARMRSGNFLRDALKSIAAGYEVPGISVSVINWDKPNLRSFTYSGEADIQDVLNKLERIGANVKITAVPSKD